MRGSNPATGNDRKIDEFCQKGAALAVENVQK
jgi:hypothetical protein